jgi:hypothetical protein
MKTLVLWLALSSLPAEKDVFACNLRGLTQVERLRHTELSRKLLGAVSEKKELDDGYAFKLPADALLEGAQWVKYEHKCCPFFTLTLEQGRDDGGPLWLKITGREGVKAFIRHEFGI